MKFISLQERHYSFRKSRSKFHISFHAFFQSNIGIFAQFHYGFFKPFNNLNVSMKKVINWYHYSETNACVHLFASKNNTNVSEITKIFSQFTLIKWNVYYNLVRMKTIVNYRNCMFVVLAVFFFFTVQRTITPGGCHLSL